MLKLCRITVNKFEDDTQEAVICLQNICYISSSSTVRACETLQISAVAKPDEQVLVQSQEAVRIQTDGISIKKSSPFVCIG